MFEIPSDVSFQSIISQKLDYALSISTCGTSSPFIENQNGSSKVGRVISVDYGPQIILAFIGVMEVYDNPPVTVIATVVLNSAGLVFTKSKSLQG